MQEITWKVWAKLAFGKMAFIGTVTCNRDDLREAIGPYADIEDPLPGAPTVGRATVWAPPPKPR